MLINLEKIKFLMFVSKNIGDVRRVSFLLCHQLKLYQQAPDKNLNISHYLYPDLV